jgi:hypothetical protein
MAAVENNPKVIAGSMICLIPPLPVDGNHPNVTANNRINIRPAQYTGIDCPKRANVMPSLS